MWRVGGVCGVCGVCAFDSVDECALECYLSLSLWVLFPLPEEKEKKKQTHGTNEAKARRHVGGWHLSQLTHVGLLLLS